MRNDFQIREEFSKGTMPPRNKKNFRPTKSGAGMTQAGVKAYRRLNPGSKLKTAVTGKVKPGSKAAKRRKSFCASIARPNEKISKSSKRSKLKTKTGTQKMEMLNGKEKLQKVAKALGKLLSYTRNNLKLSRSILRR